MKRGWRSFAAMSVALTIMACGSGSGTPVRVTIPQGATLRVAADSLAKAGVVAYPRFFRVYASMRRGDRGIRAGTYMLRPHEGWGTVLDALRRRVLNPFVWTGLHLECPPLTLRLCGDMPGHGTAWQVGLWSSSCAGPGVSSTVSARRERLMRGACFDKLSMRARHWVAGSRLTRMRTRPWPGRARPWMVRRVDALFETLRSEGRDALRLDDAGA